MAQLFTQWADSLRRGNYEEAWALSERQRGLALAAGRRSDDPALPYHLRWVWDGRSFDGRHVLVRCYHGLGDTIQFLRFLPGLRRRVASLTLEIQPRLIPLLGKPAAADRVVAFDPAQPHPPSECDLEIMELSLALRARPTAFPPPYVTSPSAALPRGTVALCCTAGDWDKTRSVPSELLAGMCKGRRCIALDPGPSALPVLNPAGCPFDMAQTAKLVAAADLVITVDTMIAHLAGALGRPAWLLLKHEPDWRWSPEAGRSDWYPTMRLFAQPRPDDWASVIASVERELDLLIPRRSMSDEPSPRLPLRPGVVGRAARQDHHSADQA